MTEVLLDTHAFIWFDLAPEKLSLRARALIQNPEIVVFVSPMTAWELGIKFALGKLHEAQIMVQKFHQKLAQYQFLELAFTSSDALRAASLPAQHKDPFDRALAAQALERNIAIISADCALDLLGVSRFW